jgi:peptidylprolyl isomerase
MATTKRERQKAARRQKLEQMERANKRRKTIRRTVIVAVVAVVVVGSAALLFSGKKTPTTTTTTTTTTQSTTTTTVATTTTTLPKISIGTIADPSPAGTFGKTPTMVIPPGTPPTTLEEANLITGTGALARDGDSLTVEYVLGTYSSRKVIQSSWTGSPFVLKALNTANVIPGWVYGVAGMRVGGRRELIIPPSLGYGDASPGAGSGIAKNDTLVFIVDLEKVVTP